eukprot:352171-Chlamydomonas_euryale.AAC.2
MGMELGNQLRVCRQHRLPGSVFPPPHPGGSAVQLTVHRHKGLPGAYERVQRPSLARACAQGMCVGGR